MTEPYITLIPILAIITFALFCTIAIINRKNSSLCVGLLSAGVIIADVVLLYGMGTEPFRLLEAFQLGTLDADYYGLLDNISAFSDTGFYKIIFIIFSFLTPFIFAGFLLSFFRTLQNETKFFLLKNFRDIYIFSEANKNSIHLAIDIKSHEKKSLIVFCQNDSDDEDVLIEARKQNFITLKKSISAFVKIPKNKLYFFALHSDENHNFQLAQELISEFAKIGSDDKVDLENVKVFIQNEKLLPVLAMDSRSTTDKKVNVIFINESEISSNELLFKKPLFVALEENNKKIEMLILGTTLCADKILRRAISCSQMGNDYSAKFIIADKNATEYKNKLMRDAPELFLKEYKIDFCDVDTHDISFTKFLDTKCKNVNYVAVALSDDDENFETGIFLRSYFIRRNPTIEQKPFIAIRLQETDCATIKNLKAAKNESYDLFAFGKASDIFSYDLLVNSELEKIAMNIHACYSWSPEWKLTKQQLIQSYNRSETDKKSNRANALHAKHKLFILGYEIKLKSEATAEEKNNSKNLVDELLQKLSDKKNLDSLSRIEHDRWCAHERSDGWISVSVEDAMSHKEKTKSQENKNGTHKFNVAKMHPCLCSWDELDVLGKAAGDDFKKYDTQICECLPKILGLIDDKEINISDTEYVLIRRA